MLFRKSKAPAAPAADAIENDASTTTTAEEHQQSDQHLSPEGQKDGGQVAKAVSRASTRAESDYPTGVRLALILLSVFVSMFLVALDRLIISTVSVTPVKPLSFFHVNVPLIGFHWVWEMSHKLLCSVATHCLKLCLPYISDHLRNSKLTFTPNRPSLKLLMTSTRFRMSVGMVVPIS